MAKKNPIRSILVLEDILCLQECRFLTALYDRYSELTSSRDYNCQLLLNYYTLRKVDNESASWLCGLALRCKEKIEGYLSTPELFVESFFIACLLPGDSHIEIRDTLALDREAISERFQWLVEQLIE